MITGLDHIAIAVSDLDAGIKRFMEDFGLDFLGTETVEGEQTTTAFFPVPGTQIELVYPEKGSGPVAGFLEKRGPGIHHICFVSDDLDSDILRLQEKGYVFTTESPVDAAQGLRAIFIHPRSCDGVLIEIAEKPRG